MTKLSKIKRSSCKQNSFPNFLFFFSFTARRGKAIFALKPKKLSDKKQLEAALAAAELKQKEFEELQKEVTNL